MNKSTIAEIIEFMQDPMGMSHFYNKETEEIKSFSPEYLNLAETDISERTLADWEIEMIEEIRDVYDDDNYIHLSEIPSYESYNIIESFISSQISNSNIQDKFYSAINGRGAFGRFFNLLKDYPVLNDLWKEYNYEQKIKYVEIWCAQNDIEM